MNQKIIQKILIDTLPIKEQYDSLTDLLSYPEVYLDSKLSKHLLINKSRVEKLVELRNLLEKTMDESLIDAINHELIVLGADTIISCTIELRGDKACKEIILKNINKTIKLNAFSEEKKEDVLLISGLGAYSFFVKQAGFHSFKGNPKGEVQMYVYETNKISSFDVEDIKIDYFRSDGAGGQNVNKLSTGVRITHTPTGLSVVCKDERSQIMNKNKALERIETLVNAYFVKEENNRIKLIKKEQDKKGIIANYLNGEQI